MLIGWGGWAIALELRGGIGIFGEICSVSQSIVNKTKVRMVGIIKHIPIQEYAPYIIRQRVVAYRSYVSGGCLSSRPQFWTDIYVGFGINGGLAQAKFSSKENLCRWSRRICRKHNVGSEFQIRRRSIAAVSEIKSSVGVRALTNPIHEWIGLGKNIGSQLFSCRGLDFGKAVLCDPHLFTGGNDLFPRKIGCNSRSGSGSNGKKRGYPQQPNFPLVFPVAIGLGGLFLLCWGLLSDVNSHRSWAIAIVAIFIGFVCTVGGSIATLIALFPVPV